MTHLCPCFRGFGIIAGSRRDDKACAALPVLHPLLPPLALCSCVHLSEGAQVGKVIAALWLAAGLMLPEGSPSNHLFSLGAGVIDRAPCLNIMENWESEIGALWAVTVSYGYSRACKVLALPSNKGRGATDNHPAHLRGPNPLAPPAGMWGLLAIQRGSTHAHTAHAFLHASSAIQIQATLWNRKHQKANPNLLFAKMWKCKRWNLRTARSDRWEASALSTPPGPLCSSAFRRPPRHHTVSSRLSSNSSMRGLSPNP